MLPYGTLWKLDEMLHAAAPQPRRTAAMRRRQALFYFFWGISLVSIFLIPFYFASLRRVRIRSERELFGLVPRSVDLKELHMRQDQALQRLTTWTTARWVDMSPQKGEGDNVGDADVTADFALVFYLQPSSRTRLDGIFAHPYVRAVAGGGVGLLWPHLGDAAESPKTLQHLPRARTLSDVAMDAANNSSSAGKCLIALRRDLLQVGGKSAEYEAETNPIKALQERLSHGARLYRMDARGSSDTGKVAVDVGDRRAATENVLAALLLGLTSRHTSTHAQEEAISHALAACQAPLSRSLRMSVDWSAAHSASRDTAPIVSTIQEETAPQYLCLCSKHGVQPPVALVDPSSGTTTPLFIADPARLEASTGTCADACLRSG